MEAIQFRLTGDLAAKYVVSYRAHVQGIGWQAVEERRRHLWHHRSGQAGRSRAGTPRAQDRADPRCTLHADADADADADGDAATRPRRRRTPTPTVTEDEHPDADADLRDEHPHAHGDGDPHPAPADTARASYSAHVQTKGWMSTVTDGASPARRTWACAWKH